MWENMYTTHLLSWVVEDILWFQNKHDQTYSENLSRRAAVECEKMNNEPLS